MLTGIFRVYAKTRPVLMDRPDELAMVDAQVERFETERVAPQARCALELGGRVVVPAPIRRAVRVC